MRHVKYFGFGLVALALAGCTIGSGGGGGLRKQLGFQDAPDEFLIIARDQIEVPASFDLPRPQPGAPSRVEVDPLADAHEALFDRPEPVRLANASPGETVLLSGAEAADDNSEVRALLAEENEDTGERQFGLTSLFGIPIPARIGEVDEVLDSIDETEELRAEGKPTPAAPPPPPGRNTGLRFIDIE